MFSNTWQRRDRKNSAPKTKLDCVMLEDRLTPAVTLKFDYSLDTSGFFNDTSKRAALEQAANDLTSRIASTPGAISPSGANTWQAVLSHPTTGSQIKIPNLTIPQGTLLIYVGGSNLPGSQAGEGGPGGFSASGSSSFMQSISKRPGAASGIWGGSLSIDTDTNWHFGSSGDGIPSGQVDFHSVAVHELGHVLGLGTAKSWDSLVKGGQFTGSSATAVYGSAPPVTADGAHWAQGIKVGGQSVSLQPTAENGRRVPLSELDYAALNDIGWQVAGVPGSAAVTTSTPTIPSVFESAPINLKDAATPPPAPVVSGSKDGLKDVKLTLVSGPNDGSLQIYVQGPGGKLIQHGAPFKPFGNFGGAVRAVAADVNGDKITDIVAATGPYGGSRMRILDGRTFQDMVPEFSVFEPAFTGGVFVASGDFNKDGRDEVVVTPDQGGGPRVRVLSLNGNTMQPVADFFGIDDAKFRGGARASVGDVNKDGRPDLVVSAGFGGGPRVSLIDGGSVLSSTPRRLTGDFFAFESTLRNGVYATVADMDGDGHGDLVFGAGPGGGPRVLAVSGQSLLTKGASSAIERPLSNLFAGNADQRGGVRVAAKDLDGDGKPEILTGSGVGGEMRVFKTNPNLNSTEVLNPFGNVDSDGIYVG